MREWRFRDYLARKFPIGGGAMSLTPLPPSPRESATLVHIFCLTGREWSLTCWAKIWGEHCPWIRHEYSQVDNLFLFAASRVSDAISLSAQTRWYYASSGGLQEPTEETKTQIEIYMHVSFQRFVTLGQKEKVWMLIDCSGWFKLVIIVISFNFFVFVLVKLIKSKSQVSWYLPRYLLRLILFNYR